MNAEEILQTIKALVRDQDQVGLSDHQIVAGFQEANGIAPDGVIGQVTARVVERPRFCAVEDKLRAKGSRARWDHTLWDGKQWRGTPTNMLLTYHVAGMLTNLSQTQTESAFAEALGYWTSVCAVVFVPTADPSKANLLCKVGRIDGASSTLAWCELPEGRDTPQTQLNALFDSGEPWVSSADPPANRIDAVRVICHEIGHGLGLDHGPEGNLLAPYYDPHIRAPQAWDISEAQLRYGPPVPVTPTTPPPVPPANPNTKATVTVRFPNGQTYQGEIENANA